MAKNLGKGSFVRDASSPHSSYVFISQWSIEHMPSRRAATLFLDEAIALAGNKIMITPVPEKHGHLA